MFTKLRKLKRDEPQDDYPLRFIDGREVYPPEGESLEDWHERKWAELPRELQRRAINHLRDYVFEQDDLHTLRSWWDQAGEDWPHTDFTPEAEQREIEKKYGFYVPTPFHFHSGMYIRNELRNVVKDDELPTGNWDDLYIPAIERAIGVRE